MPRTTPKNIEWLRENGPAPERWLPNATVYKPRERERGMRKLKLVGNPAGDGDRQGGHNEPIYYLPDHDPERIVRVFLMENPHLIENLSYQGLINRFGGAGKDIQNAARRVLDETDIRRREYPDGYGDHGKQAGTLGQRKHWGWG